MHLVLGNAKNSSLGHTVETKGNSSSCVSSSQKRRIRHTDSQCSQATCACCVALCSFTAEHSEMEQHPTKTKQASNLKATTFTRCTLAMLP